MLRWSNAQHTAKATTTVTQVLSTTDNAFVVQAFQLLQPLRRSAIFLVTGTRLKRAVDKIESRSTKILHLRMRMTLRFLKTTCHSDVIPKARSGRSLDYSEWDNLNITAMTTETCLTACGAKGFPFAGTEFGRECYCGVVLGNGTVAADATQCSTPCTGNSTQYCGGLDHLSLYVAKNLESTEPCGPPHFFLDPQSDVVLLLFIFYPHKDDIIHMHRILLSQNYNNEAKYIFDNLQDVYSCPAKDFFQEYAEANLYHQISFNVHFLGQKDFYIEDHHFVQDYSEVNREEQC
ncbi:hypothetical protein N0V90_002125 [Kalmusia sp. IMI 367209]|nr:hypothetical protein N0V90_002125 [Kalmusia sp. IMI 367209]